MVNLGTLNAWKQTATQATATSTYQIRPHLQVQNHFPTNFRAVTPARALGSRHNMSPASAQTTLPALLSHTTPPPCLLLGHRHPPCPAAPPPPSIFFLSLYLAASRLLFSWPSKTLKWATKLTEMRACPLVLKHWIGQARQTLLESIFFLKCLSITFLLSKAWFWPILNKQ